jgi:hypothetical protein
MTIWLGCSTRLLATSTRNRRQRTMCSTIKRGIAYRGVYIIDPNGILRWAVVHNLSVERNVDDVLRVLDALQTDKLCPCNWSKGQDTLNSSNSKSLMSATGPEQTYCVFRHRFVLVCRARCRKSLSADQVVSEAPRTMPLCACGVCFVAVCVQPLGDRRF